MFYLNLFLDASGQLTCNFDRNLCSWTQRSDDQFDWIQHSGSTSDSTSGPDRDHSTGSKCLKKIPNMVSECYQCFDTDIVY
jgi:hypothetical protein